MFDFLDTNESKELADGRSAESDLNWLDIICGKASGAPTGPPGSSDDKSMTPSRRVGNVMLNAGGKISHVDYSERVSRDIEYKNEKVSKLTYLEDGKIYDQWQLGKDGKYHRFVPDSGKSGKLKASRQIWSGSVDIDQQTGDLVYKETDSNDVITERAATGQRIAEGPDGIMHVMDSDGTSYDHIDTGNGAYTEKHSGPLPEETYEITRTADGKYAIKEGNSWQQYDATNQDVRVERVILRDLVEAKIFDPEQSREFEANMQEFESRMRQMEKTYEKQLAVEFADSWIFNPSPAEIAGLARERARKEVAATYGEIIRLLNNGDHAQVSEADLTHAARDLMRQAANPSMVDQGQHNTCNVASLESQFYATHPSAVARVVADVAVSGTFTARSGAISEPRLSDLLPDSEAQADDPSGKGRSFASQLFQITAVNIYYSGKSFVDAKGRKTIRYEQDEFDAGIHRDTGERLIHLTKVPPEPVKGGDGKPMAGTGVGADEIAYIREEITGQKDFHTITHVDRDKTNYQHKTLEIKGQEDLKDALESAQKEGRLPIIVEVNTRNEPFYTDSGAGAAGGSGSWHLLLVTDFDAGTRRVQIDNQWGEAADHNTKERAIPLHELYVAMRDPDNPESIQDLEDDLAADKAAGVANENPVKRLELLARRYGALEISDADLTAGMEAVCLEMARKLSRHDTPAEVRLEYRAAYGKIVKDMHDSFPAFDWKGFAKRVNPKMARIWGKQDKQKAKIAE